MFLKVNKNKTIENAAIFICIKYFFSDKEITFGVQSVAD